MPLWRTAITLAGAALLGLWFLSLAHRVGATPRSSLLIYLAAFTVLAMLPGYALSRLALPSPRTWFAMLGQAMGVGIVLTLVFWAATVGTGLSWLGWLLSLAVIAASLAVPSWRCRLRFRPAEQVNPWSALAMYAGAVYSLQQFTRQLAPSLMFPLESTWYQDNFWHLAINGVLKTRLIPDYPQVLGEPLSYHWLANAHMAFMGLSTGLGNDLVLARLWFVPMIAAAALLACAVIESASPRASFGPLAAALMLAIPNLRPADWIGLDGFDVWVPFSPSQTIAVPFLLLVVLVSQAIMHRGPALAARGAASAPAFWAVTVLVFLLAPGTKSSTLPMVAAGAALVLLIALVTRGAWRGPAVVVALSGAATVLTAPLFAGSGAGTHLQLGSSMRHMKGWNKVVGLDPSISTSPILPGISSPGLLLLALALLVLAVGVFGWAMPGIAALATERSLRGTATWTSLWFLLGIGIAGFCAMMLIDHDGLSQMYFMRGAAAPLACFAALGADVLVSRIQATGSRALTGLLGASALILGALIGWSYRSSRIAHPGKTTPVSDYVSFISSAAFMTATAGLVLAALFILARRRRGWMFRVAAVLTLALGVAGAAATLPSTWQSKFASASTSTTTAPRFEAALWVRDHTDPEAVVATNVHCLSRKSSPNCDARGFWVSAASERQTYIEGWAYSAEAHKMHGREGRIYAFQPFHDAQRFAANEAAFTKADPAALAELKAAGVDYLFADRKAGPVSPQLAQRADLVFQNSEISVYRLR